MPPASQAGHYEFVIALHPDRVPENLMDLITNAICPNPEEPDHQDHCPLFTMSGHPVAEPIDLDGVDPEAIKVARDYLTEAEIWKDVAPEMGVPIADALISVLRPWLKGPLLPHQDARR